LKSDRGFVRWIGFAIMVVVPLLAVGESPTPKPPGKLVDLGGHKLHVYCTGHGGPTVVVENGLGDFSFDWTLVQSQVSRFTRICTYDRAGYAWSDPGPKPRTFAQINLELHDALEKLGERGPFVLVGHSYGGPVMRNFAAQYPKDAAGMVLVDSAVEGMRVGVGGKATIQLGVNVQTRDVPPPHEQMSDADKSSPAAPGDPHPPAPLDPLYKALPAAEQKLQIWAQDLPQLEDAENSQREWSDQYFSRWLADPKAASLGALPIMVLTRRDGGYKEDLDVPATQLERERKEGQEKLTRLSSNGEQGFINSGHNMEIEAPADVATAIRMMVDRVRSQPPAARK
jgi:pimeloyl-ACP methyl ester carboxylesterase